MQRIIRSLDDVNALAAALLARTLPVTVAVVSGVKRTNKQNRLQRQWMNDITREMGEGDEHWRAYCKLHYGVPILRRDVPAFTETYDRVIRPLDYDVKLDLMRTLDIPVTRLMTTKQKAEYLDCVEREFRARGVHLTDPEGLE